MNKTYEQIKEEVIEYVEHCSKGAIICLYKELFGVELIENDDLSEFEVTE